MIDLEKAKEEFLRYAQNFDLEVKEINRKLGHSFRVMDISKKIAMDLNLDQEKVELATLIGLLHDIARFEQYTQFKTFNDFVSFDHGNYGVELLEKNNTIRKYIETDKYDETIKKAIKNHNKFSIEEGITKEEELFCKIIRDADKLDIFYEAIIMFWENEKEAMEDGEIREDVKDQFLNKKLINKKDIPNRADIGKVIQILAFIYDINYASSFKIIKENRYIDKIVNKFNFKKEKTRKEIEEIRDIANQYVEEKSK